MYTKKADTGVEFTLQNNIVKLNILKIMDTREKNNFVFNNGL